MIRLELISIQNDTNREAAKYQRYNQAKLKNIDIL